MWYDRFEFFDKQPGLQEVLAPDFFSKPLTEQEIKMYPDLRELYPEFLFPSKLLIPTELTVPDEHQQLLVYSNGGGIINGEREFGYFSCQDIRWYYFGYGFLKRAPYLLPIAFNGGGKFYAYDFRDAAGVTIVAVGAGDLAYENSVVLGRTLLEVLSNPSNIEEALDALYK